MDSKKTKKTPEELPVCVALVVCDQVVNGSDGTATLVRIVDTIGVDPENTPKQGERMELGGARVFISLKGGKPKKRKFEMMYSVIDPSGERSKVGHATVISQVRPETGHHVNSPLRLVWGGEGVYWIELTIGKKLIARSPIRLLIAAPKDFQSKIAELNKAR